MDGVVCVLGGRVCRDSEVLGELWEVSARSELESRAVGVVEHSTSVVRARRTWSELWRSRWSCRTVWRRTVVRDASC